MHSFIFQYACSFFFLLNFISALIIILSGRKLVLLLGLILLLLNIKKIIYIKLTKQRNRLKNNDHWFVHLSICSFGGTKFFTSLCAFLYALFYSIFYALRTSFLTKYEKYFQTFPKKYLLILFHICNRFTVMLREYYMI